VRQRDLKPPRLGTHDSAARREGRRSGARHAARGRNVNLFKKGRSISRAAFLLHHAEGGSAITGETKRFHSEPLLMGTMSVIGFIVNHSAETSPTCCPSLTCPIPSPKISAK